MSGIQQNSGRLHSGWLEPRDLTPPEGLYQAVGGHPLVAQALLRRGIVDIQTARAFLFPEEFQPLPPTELPGLEQAANRLDRAIRDKELVCVWGDFDVDGQTATAVLVEAITRLGGRVIYHIPVRAKESHGISVPILKQILEPGSIHDNDPRWPAGDWPPAGLLLTCDTGISAHEALQYAWERGVDVIVTDHHALPERLPPAAAIINPRMCREGSPLVSLPGVGVAFKLVEELFRRSGKPEESDRFLDLVALGIVADLASLTGETRFLLQRGLVALRETKRPGLQVMMELAELEAHWLTEEHIGYELAPRLNALGRLADANPAVDFLTSQDLGRARILAYQLEALNSQRKLVSNQVYQAALRQLERDPAQLDQAALVLAHPAWEPGIIGIVASRLVERYHKPVILIAMPPAGPGRGSARSVEGVDITSAISANQEYLVNYGGHPMAAGFSILPEKIDDFRRSFYRIIEKIGRAPQPVLQIDGQLSLSELTLDIVSDLERLAPHGPGNPALILVAREIRIIKASPVGKEGDHLVITLQEDQSPGASPGAERRVIWWQGGSMQENLPTGLFDLAYHVRTSTYRGQRDIQIEWIDYKPIAEENEAEQSLRQIEIVDNRRTAQPKIRLKQLLEEQEIQIWAEAEGWEGLNKGGIVAHSRYSLGLGDTLAIWTTPPGWEELRIALQRAQPKRIILFCIDPANFDINRFIHRLAGMVKFAITTQSGHIIVDRLAAACAQPRAAVMLGIEWLVATGKVAILKRSDTELILAPGSGIVDQEQDRLTSHLRIALQETESFRSFFQRIDRHSLTDQCNLLLSY